LLSSQNFWRFLFLLKSLKRIENGCCLFWLSNVIEKSELFIEFILYLQKEPFPELWVNECGFFLFLFILSFVSTTSFMIGSFNLSSTCYLIWRRKKHFPMFLWMNSVMKCHTLVVNFTNILHAVFTLIFFGQKITKQNCKHRKTELNTFEKKLLIKYLWNRPQKLISSE